MVVIVTDSAVGYSREELSKRKVQVVGLQYMASDIAYTEKLRGEDGDFFKVIRGRKCKTSQPTCDKFIEQFSSITSKGDEVLCITISSAMSGTHSCATLASKQVAGKVVVFDSQTTACGQQLLIDEAVNMIVGGMSMDEIVKNLEVIRTKIRIVFSVEDTKPLETGGRFIPTASSNTTLNSRPILECKTKVDFVENVRGQKARIDALIDTVPDTARRIFVIKVGNETDTSAIQTALGSKFPTIKIHIRTLGPVLSIHLGEGTMGVAYITK